MEEEPETKRPRTHEDIELQVKEKKLKKKEKKLKKKAEKFEPELEFKPSDYPHGIKLKDVKDLILWIVSDGVAPKWILVKRKYNVKSVVTLMVSELTQDIYDKFEQTKELFPISCPVQCAGDKRKLFSPHQTLLTYNLSKEERKKYQYTSDVYSSRPKNEKITIHDLLLSQETLIENLYPIVSNEDQKNEFKDYIQLSSILESPYNALAIDCEMSYTKNGLELTRISIVDENLKVVYDSFVLPKDQILDYNTRYSGITPAMMENVTTSIQDVQNFFLKNVSSKTILIGHSLENDLRALKIIHKRVIDTALIYHHLRGPPYKPSLKYLAQRYLEKDIQQELSGHDSIEDANVAMMLVNLKVKNGPTFGEIHADCIRLALKLKEGNKTTAIMDTQHICNTFGLPPATSFPTQKDSSVVEYVKENSSKYDFIFSRFLSLENYYRNEANGTNNDISIDELAKNIDSNIFEVYDSLPKNTLFILVSGTGKAIQARKLLEQKTESKKLSKLEAVDDTEIIPEEDVKWSHQDEENLEKEVSLARQGLGFFCIKS